MTHKSELSPLRPAPDTILYHYTSAQALVEIIRSNSLRATDLRFMRDFSELEYASRLILTCLRERKETDHFDQRLAGLFDKLSDYAGLLPGAAIFCFSLSEQPDQLSQWRSYGGNGSGYSIGFSAQALAGYLVAEREQPIAFLKVLYDETAQRKVFNSLLDEALELSTHHGQPAIEYIPWDGLLLNLLRPLLHFCAGSKSPAFQEEQEWRVAYIHQLTEQASPDEVRDYYWFQAKEGILAPAVVLHPKEGKLSIQRIVLGPNIEPETGKEVLQLLLTESGFGYSVEIAQSTAPSSRLRGIR